jgi:intracellular sulfur oxidation DsrE/DsrF family protein
MMNLLARGAFVACALLLLARPGLATEKAAGHHIVIQVSQNDPERMNLALNNTQNAIKYYSDKGQTIAVEIVAYGPGLNMLREDTSPVKERIKEMKASNIGPDIHFSACHNTQIAMEKKEGHPIPIIPQAVVVPAGIVRLTQLQEEGWSYIRP